VKDKFGIFAVDVAEIVVLGGFGLLVFGNYHLGKFGGL
jgi:hypothetical protein